MATWFPNSSSPATTHPNAPFPITFFTVYRFESSKTEHDADLLRRSRTSGALLFCGVEMLSPCDSQALRCAGTEEGPEHGS
eukprot:752390-Hanusia_phi.AAC.2